MLVYPNGLGSSMTVPTCIKIYNLEHFNEVSCTYCSMWWLVPNLLLLNDNVGSGGSFVIIFGTYHPKL